MSSIIFYFSGTGNSLKVAKDLATTLPDCTLVNMGKPYKLVGSYDTIGFVYPVYSGGMPAVVEQFIDALDISENKNAYIFAVCTSGAMVGGLSNIAKIIAEKGGKLSYGENIACFANYVCLYPMAADVDAKVAAQETATQKVAGEIAARTVKPIPKNGIMSLIHGGFLKTLHSKDKGFNVSDACNGCGTCANVCSVGNIEMRDGKPHFQHQCEQCVACIQWCPKQAINYKNKTQTRGRYHHPDISVAEIAGGQ